MSRCYACDVPLRTENVSPVTDDACRSCVPAPKHTPGPWQHGKLSDDIITDSGEPIASPPDDYDEDVWPANARLIAAAPDLLNVLRQMVVLYDGVRDMIGASVKAKLERADAAIAKAEGR